MVEYNYSNDLIIIVLDIDYYLHNVSGTINYLGDIIGNLGVMIELLFTRYD